MTNQAEIVGSTPEFVRWAIARECPLREFEAWQEPEQVERRLKPLRSYAEAVAQGRVFEGICVAANVAGLSNAGGCESAASPALPKGFRASEVLDAYGGAEFVTKLCGECPANARRTLEPEPLAGCFGHVEFSALDRFHADLESVVATLGVQAACDAEFLPTTPRWYGFWIEPNPNRRQLELLHQVFCRLAESKPAYEERLRVFLMAVGLCLSEGLPLRLTLTPRGEYTATRWTIVSHCGRCRAPWPNGPRHCAACGVVGHPQPSRQRHVRGDRPYWRLAGFLGAANVEPFLQRYFDSRRVV